jgi:hypothetical protein
MSSDFILKEDTMLKPFATLVSCQDTIHSECPRGDTLEECVDRCRKDPKCASGYYLEPTFERQSYCVPLNSALHKNMNLMLNIYPREKDPTAHLWKRSVLFFRPTIYPEVYNDTTIIMQKDICHMTYTVNATKKIYYLQQDMTWKENGKNTAMRVLFIDVFPQFYELARTIQDRSIFVLKIFSRPKIVAVSKDVFTELPYLVQNGEISNSNLFIHIPQKRETSPIDYPVLQFMTPFQIFVDDRSHYMGFLKKKEKKNSKSQVPSVITLRRIPASQEFPGFFMVYRVDIQPNIYKVAEILPARLTFLEKEVLPSTTDDEADHRRIILISVAIIMMIITIGIVFFYILTRK